jgi:hypothetical protein
MVTTEGQWQPCKEKGQQKNVLDTCKTCLKTARAPQQNILVDTQAQCCFGTEGEPKILQIHKVCATAAALDDDKYKQVRGMGCTSDHNKDWMGTLMTGLGLEDKTACSAEQKQWIDCVERTSRRFCGGKAFCQTDNEIYKASSGLKEIEHADSKILRSSFPCCDSKSECDALVNEP